MIKIDCSLLDEKDSHQLTAKDKHLSWFLEQVQKKCKWNRKITRKDFLIQMLKLDKTKDFVDQIKPYLFFDEKEIKKVGNCRILLENLIAKHDAELRGIKRANKHVPKEGMIKKRTTHLLEAFGYEDFDGKHVKDNKWDAYKLCEILKIDVCPYCNRLYIFTVRNEKNYCLTRPEIDHFYPKDIYPYLSCNLYNFIPSCHTCNNSKSDKDEAKSMVYPYDEDFGNNGVFRAKINGTNIDVNEFFEGKLDENKIKLAIVSNNDKVDKSKKVLHLEEIYNMHRLDLLDFLNRYKNYSDPERKFFAKLFESAINAKKIDESQMNYFFDVISKQLEKQILGMHDVPDGKQYPLKKMKEDLKKQLDGNLK